MTTKILDSKSKRYISDVLKANHMNDLPDNVMFNKITTGSGMTSEALQNDTPYVICVPKKNLIKNKVKWCEDRGIDIIGVYAYSESGVGVEEITAFKGNKILTSYDSLHKVVTALTNNNRISDFKIMIDEAHELIKAGNYRYGAIDSVLTNYTKFKSFIFGTATPIDDRYQHPKLRHISKVQVKWYDLEPVTINYCRYDKDLLKATAVVAIKHLTGEMSTNAHFFINSVNDIASIIRYIKKGGYSDPSQIKIITANSDSNEYKLVQSLGKGYNIADINSTSRKLNFYTSTAFEGVDILDENALTYIISDGSNSHSKIDVLITLPQIIGRIRDAKITNFVNLLYSPNRYYSHTTEDEFEYFTKSKLKEAEKYIVRFNNESEDMIKEALLKAANDNVYLRVDDDNNIILNDTALYSEMQNFKTLNTTYYAAKFSKDENSLKDIKVNEINYSYGQIPKVEIKGLNKAKLGAKVNFPMICEKYNTADIFELMEITKVEPIIPKAYDILGYSKLKALKFRKKDIQEALVIADSERTNGWKIFNMLDLKVGNWISIVDAKTKLEEIYSTLNLNVSIKSTDLAKFYIIKPSSKRIDSIKVKGYIILSAKYKSTK